MSQNVEFFIYEDDRPRALVEAQSMERYEREDSTYTLLRAAADSVTSSVPSGSSGRVTARIYSSSEGEAGEDGEDASRRDTARVDSVSATIRADRIVYRDDERRFEARGRVVVTTPTGRRLEGEHLAWLEEEHRITTPGFVTITTPADRIQGYGLRADENLDSYQLGRVTGQVTVEDAS